VSVLYFIKTKKNINFENVFNQLTGKYRNLSAEEREDNYVHFYLNGMSIRGVGITVEKNKIEIKNNVLSNEYDLMLANDLLKCISEMTNENVYNEDNILLENTYINEETVKNNFANDLETIFTFIQGTGKIIEFPGPTRSFFIGKKIYNTYKDFSKPLLFEVLQKIILYVLYGLPDYRECTPMGAKSKNDDEIIKLKVFSNDDNCIIQDYDYIMIGDSKNEIIMISLDKIYEILPKDWKIVDESTIVANKLNENDWNIFMDKCIKNNCYNEFREKAI
jgi:hypothetical protein